MARKYLSPLNLLNLTSDPGSATEGDFYWNSSSNKLRIYFDGAWGDANTLPANIAYKDAANTFTTAQTITPATSVTGLAINAAASSKGLTVKANATTPGNLQEWQDSSAAVILSVSSTADLISAGNRSARFSYFQNVGGTGAYLDYASVSNTALILQRVSSAVGLIVKGAASQSSDLIQAQTSAGSVVFKVSPTGVINAGGTTTIGNVLTFSDPGVATETRFNFTRTSDSAWLAVNEFSSDSTYYEFGMADNPSGGDYFQWRFDNYEAPSHGWMPLQMSGYLTRFMASSNTMYGNFALPFNTPYATINNALTSAATYNVSRYTPTQNTSQSLSKDAGTGTGTVTLNSQSFTGSSRTGYWIEIEAGGTTFKWGNGWTGLTAVATAVAITGSAQTLNNGVSVTISTTGHVAGDKWSFVVHPRNTIAIGGTPLTTAMQTVYPSSGIIGSIIRGASGQSVSLQEWQDSSANVLSKVDQSGNITAASFIKTSGTSAQFLKADGSVDSSTYLTTGTASSTYAPLASPTFTGAPAWPNSKVYGFTRTMPTVANNIVELGSSTLANGAGAFEISVVVPSSAFSLTKQYLVPVNYNETGNTWQIVNPIAEGGPYVSEDYTLEINVNNSVASFRLRRTTGTTAGTAYVSLKINGNAPTFTESSGTASVTAPTVYYNGAIITQKDGAATINGNLTATQLIRSGGTSSQFLKADGSVDSSTYLTTATASSTYLPLTGGTISSNLIITGDLTVNGTTTNLNSTNLVIEDKNIILGDTTTPSNTTADGGGITLKGATDKTFNWVNSTSSWTSSEDLDLATGKVLKIAGTQVLSASQYTGNAATVTNGVYTNGSYSNPSWITGLAWSKISTTPTTLSGYGITDAIDTSATGQTKSGTLTAASFIPTSSTVPTNGMYLSAANTLNFSTNTTSRITIDSSGNIGIGTAPTTAYSIQSSKNLTGAVTAIGFHNSGTVQSDVTSAANIFYTTTGTAAASFTLGNLRHYMAVQGTFGVGSSVTNQIGFIVNSNLIGATNNYGFYGDIPSGSNRWNAYMSGTAANYFAGQTNIGSTSLTLGGGSVAQQFGVVPSATTTVGIVIRGAASQTADLQQWQNSAGGNITRIDTYGRLGITTSSLANSTGGFSQVAIANVNTTDTQLVIRSYASQTANLQEWQNSSAVAVASLSPAGLFTAVSKSFDIQHPTKPDMRLRYGSLEGPENGVYVRGVTKENVIELPEYWTALVDESTITATISSVGKFQKVYVEKIEGNKVYIGGRVKEISYVVFGERKDIDKITVEY